MNWYMLKHNVDLWLKSRSFNIDEFWENARKVKNGILKGLILADWSIQVVNGELVCSPYGKRWYILMPQQREIWFSRTQSPKDVLKKCTLPKTTLYEMNYAFVNLVKTYCPE